MNLSRFDPRQHNTMPTLAAAITTVVMITTALSLFGVNDPTHGWRVTERITTRNALMLIGSDDGFHRWELPTLPTAPYLIEARWNAMPTSLKRWGIWLVDADGLRHDLRIDTTGYLSTDANMGWQPFIHVAPSANMLIVQVEADGALTWRVNDEIAHTETVATTSIQQAGLLLPHDAAPSTISIVVYTRP